MADTRETHAALLADRRRRAAAHMTGGPNVFRWDGRDYSGRRVGCRFEYGGAADLTAALLHWHASGAAGDVPPVPLADLIGSAGPLWDRATADAVCGD